MAVNVAEYKALMSKRGRPRGPNRTETAYGGYLELLKRQNVVSWYGFEVITFKLAHDTRYTPDFSVCLSNGEIEFHEVKGFFRDDAKVKIRVAAAMFPFRFMVVRKLKRGWDVETVSGGANDLQAHSVEGSEKRGRDRGGDDSRRGLGSDGGSQHDSSAACGKDRLFVGHDS